MTVTDTHSTAAAAYSWEWRMVDAPACHNQPMVLDGSVVAAMPGDVMFGMPEGQVSRLDFVCAYCGLGHAVYSPETPVFINHGTGERF